MNKRLITPPANLAVSIEAARRAARITGAVMDADLIDKITDITEEAEHITGRAFVSQTWEVTLDAFLSAIKLPNPRLVSVTSVQFYDVADVLQTLDPRDYHIDLASEPGWVMPAAGKAWPATSTRVGAVVVRYVCGYGPDYNSVPPSVRGYILGMLENAYFPNPNAQYLVRKLDRETVYG